MLQSKSTVLGLLALVTALTLTTGAEAAGRGGGGHSGGGHVAGGASFAAHAGGGGVSFAARAGGVRFVGAPAPVRVAAFTRGHFVGVGDRDHGRHRRVYAGYGGYGYYDVPFVSYGYFSSYDRCGKLRALYKETGLKKWRLRYEACRDGDDD